MSSWYFLLVGLPTWALVDGTWSVLASLAATSPQGFYISSYLTLSLTLGNLIPLVVGHMMKKTATPDVYNMIMGILSLGFMCGVLISIFYDSTAAIGGVEYSLALYILFFIVGCCSSTSNVTHYVFVSKFSPNCTTILSTGMAVGSMIAGLTGLAQGLLLAEYGFTVFWYFLSLTCLYIIAIFFLRKIRTHPRYQSVFEVEEPVSILSDLSDHSGGGLHRLRDSDPNDKTFDNYPDYSFLKKQFNIPMKYKPYLVCQLINAICGYGILPSLISATSSKFGGSIRLLQLATGISCTLDPVGRYATSYVRIESLSAFVGATSCIILLTLVSVCITLAKNTSSGSESAFYSGDYNYVPIMLYVCCNVLFGFVNTCMFRFFKGSLPTASQDSYQLMDPHRSNKLSSFGEDQESKIDSKQSYRLLGMLSQCGAMIGSITIFILVYNGII